MENMEKAQKHFHMSLGGTQYPIHLTYGKSFEIYFNPEDGNNLKELQHRRTSNKYTKETSTESSSRSPQNFQNPSFLNIRYDEFPPDDPSTDSSSLEQLKEHIKDKHGSLLKKEIEDLSNTIQELEAQLKYRKTKTKNKIGKSQSTSKKHRFHSHRRHYKQTIHESSRKHSEGKANDTKQFFRKARKNVKSLEKLFGNLETIFDSSKSVSESKGSRAKNNSKLRYECGEATEHSESPRKCMPIKAFTAQLTESIRKTKHLHDFNYNKDEITKSLQKKPIQVAELLYEDTKNVLEALNQQLILGSVSDVFAKVRTRDSRYIHERESCRNRNDSAGNSKNSKYYKKYKAVNGHVVHKTSSAPHLSSLKRRKKPLGTNIPGTDEMAVEMVEEKEYDIQVTEVTGGIGKTESGGGSSNVVASCDTCPSNDDNNKHHRKYSKRKRSRTLNERNLPIIANAKLSNKNCNKSSSHCPKKDEYVCKTIRKQTIRQYPPQNEKRSAKKAPLKSKNEKKKLAKSRKSIKNSAFKISPCVSSIRMGLMEVLTSNQQRVPHEKSCSPVAEETFESTDLILRQSMVLHRKHAYTPEEFDSNIDGALHNNDGVTNQSMRSDRQTQNESNSFPPLQELSFNDNDTKGEMPLFKNSHSQTENAPSVVEGTVNNNDEVTNQSKSSDIQSRIHSENIPSLQELSFNINDSKGEKPSVSIPHSQNENAPSVTEGKVHCNDEVTNKPMRSDRQTGKKSNNVPSLQEFPFNINYSKGKQPSVSVPNSQNENSSPVIEGTVHSNDEATNQSVTNKSMLSDSQSRNQSDSLPSQQGIPRNGKDSKDENSSLTRSHPQTENYPTVKGNTLANNEMNKKNTLTVKEFKNTISPTRHNSAVPDVKEFCDCSKVCKNPKHLKPSEYNYTSLDRDNKSREQFLNEITNNLKNVQSTMDSDVKAEKSLPNEARVYDAHRFHEERTEKQITYEEWQSYKAIITGTPKEYK